MTDNEPQCVRVICIGHASPQLVRPDELLRSLRQFEPALQFVAIVERFRDATDDRWIKVHAVRRPWAAFFIAEIQAVESRAVVVGDLARGRDFRPKLAVEPVIRGDIGNLVLALQIRSRATLRDSLVREQRAEPLAEGWCFLVGWAVRHALNDPMTVIRLSLLT